MSKMFNYESDHIHDMVHPNLLTDTTHYVAECKDIILTETTPNYPKLTDYESEWLYFYENIYQPGTPVDLEYQEVIVNPYASVLNAIPYKYKSAILSGNTLVNLCDKTKSVYSVDGNKISWQNIIFNTNSTQLTVINHTDKVIKFTVHNRTNDNWVSTNRVEANSKSIVNCGTNNYLKDLYGAYSDGWSNTEEDKNILKDGVLILEGDHTQEDIPYFEGMQSVQMPVLKTSNEDGTKTNILTVNEPIELRGIGDVKDELNLLTGEVTQRIEEIVLNGSESWKTGLWKNQVEGIGFEVKIKNDVNPSEFVKAISDKILYDSSNKFQNDGEYFDMVGAGNGETWIRMRILRSKLSTEDVEGLKKWLSQNNIKILYEISDKHIKTVDLNGGSIKPYEGTNHYYTSSDTIPPICMLSIPVESIGAKTLNDISQED